MDKLHPHLPIQSARTNVLSLVSQVGLTDSVRHNCLDTSGRQVSLSFNSLDFRIRFRHNRSSISWARVLGMGNYSRKQGVIATVALNALDRTVDNMVKQ